MIKKTIFSALICTATLGCITNSYALTVATDKPFSEHLPSGYLILNQTHEPLTLYRDGATKAKDGSDQENVIPPGGLYKIDVNDTYWTRSGKLYGPLSNLPFNEVRDDGTWYTTYYWDGPQKGDIPGLLVTEDDSDAYKAQTNKYSYTITAPETDSSGKYSVKIVINDIGNNIQNLP